MIDSSFRLSQSDVVGEGKRVRRRAPDTPTWRLTPRMLNVAGGTFSDPPLAVASYAVRPGASWAVTDFLADLVQPSHCPPGSGVATEAVDPPVHVHRRDGDHWDG
jgi:hypothetical protein